MHMFCSAWSIVPPCECRRLSFIWICLMVLFAVRRGCVRVSFIVWGTEGGLCLLYKIYDRVDHSMKVYLNCFVAARSTRASATLDELALAIPRCRIDQFSRSFLPAAVRLWNLLPSSVFSGKILSTFQERYELVPTENLAWFLIFISVSFCCSIACLISWFLGRFGL